MKGRLTLADLPPRFQAQIAAQLATKTKAKPSPIRQDSKGLNKTEAAFVDYLRFKWPGELVLAQSVTLKLANGVRYTPDFIVPQATSAKLMLAYEVKGFMRDDAAVKIKVAAANYPWIKFYLVKRDGRTGWQINEVLP